MALDRLPLFPLGHVLMPGSALPLRIFEPRYRRLLADVSAPDGARRFGVVSLTTGLEVADALDDSAPQFAQVGTVAELLEVQPGPDGTASVLTGGSQRFRIHRLVDTELPYLLAEVSYLEELTGSLPAALPVAAIALAVEYLRIVTRLTGHQSDRLPGGEGSEPYPRDPILLSYRLAAEAPLSLPEHQQLLEDETATARLLRVQRALRRELVLLRRTRSIAVSPAVLRAVLGAN